MLHPVVILLLWLGAVVLTQALSTTWLWSWLAAVALLAAGVAPQRWGQLLRRSRILLVGLLLLFGWGTPGEWCWPLLAGASPTWEGLLLALEQGGRLVALLALVACLLQLLPPPMLVMGLSGLVSPSSWRGQHVAVNRFALRLLLVLQELTHERDWRDWAQALHPHASLSCPELSCVVPRWHVRDHAALLLTGCMWAAGVWLWLAGRG